MVMGASAWERYSVLRTKRRIMHSVGGYWSEQWELGEADINVVTLGAWLCVLYLGSTAWHPEMGRYLKVVWVIVCDSPS